jgi:TonB-linked SusC/RagA family outer membrane protein
LHLSSLFLFKNQVKSPCIPNNSQLFHILLESICAILVIFLTNKADFSFIRVSRVEKYYFETDFFNQKKLCMRKIFTLMLMSLLFMQAWAQEKTVTGRVLDPNGQPVESASVLVKGTNIGTSTNADGRFELKVPANAKTLTISAVGFSDFDAAIGSRTSFEVSLVSADKDLDEVVVVAYGTARKEAMTGSVSTISAKQIESRPITNATAALEGNVPGLITTSANGQPGSGVAIRVRGFGSLSATSDPLYVIDGVPYVGGTSNLNADDIESISVLKDASSTSLYGSRAANGVVIITTKKGKKGKATVNIKAMEGVASRGLKEYERLNPFQYYPAYWESYRNSLVYPASGTGISLDSANRVASGLTSRTGISNLLAYNPFNVPANSIVGTDGLINPNASLIFGDDLDWTNDLMRRGTRRDYNININGGADKMDYLVSMGYLKEDGYTIRSDFERYNARINVNVQPTNWLKAGLNIAGNYTFSNTASDDGSTSFVNPFFFSRNIGPIYPVYAHNMTTGELLLDDAGRKIYDLGNLGNSGLGIPNRPSGGFSGRHALAETRLNENYFRRTAASVRNYFDIIFNKNFKFTNNISVDVQNGFEQSSENTLVGDGAPAGRSRRVAGTNLGVVLNQLLNYNNTFGDHKIDVIAGHETYNQQLTEVNGFKQGQSLSGNTELGNYTTINSLNSSLDRYRIESYFSRINYDLKSKYLLSASVRTDGNSRFARESRWGTFWSFGAGWNIAKENFMSNVSWVDNLKLRASYGEVGNADGIGYYAYQGLYGFANNANEAGIVQSQTAFFNPNLTWEVNKQTDVGVEFSLFKSRLSGSVEYYYRVSDDLLYGVPQALSSGALSINQNTATMFNKGFELQLIGEIIRKRDFTWSVTANITTIHNEISKMPIGQDEIISGTKKLSKGRSIYDFWLRQYYGVDPTDGAALYLPINSQGAANIMRYITNKDGGTDTVTTSINNARFEYNGSVIPDFYGSFATNFTYKNFTLNALFSYQVGGQTYDGLYASLMSVSNYGGASHVDILNRWQKPGDITNVPRMDAGRSVDFNAASNRWLTDASFINLRNINLSYSLPASLISKANISRASLFVTAENVFFSSKRIGMNNQQAFTGVTSNAYPPARIISMGLTATL